jgi:hypothetical protein
MLTSLLRIATLLLTLAGSLITSSARADEPNKSVCDDITIMLRKEMAQMKRAYEVYTLRKGDEAAAILMVANYDESAANDDSGLYMPWILMERVSPTDPAAYCISGRGTKIEALTNEEDSKFEERYGMPGSGYPRCSHGGDLVEGIKVRFWANRELGKSFVLYLHNDQGDNFTFLLGEPSPWVLLRSRQDTSAECYYDRGDNAILRSRGPLPN